MGKKSHIYLTVVSLVALAALMFGLFLSQHLKSEKLKHFNGTYLEKPRSISDFALTGIDHKKFTNQTLRGQWTMVFFGFTSCKSVCPMTMAELSNMYTILAQNKSIVLPQVVMISVDPQRDNLERLAQYVQAFNSNFYGARGEESSIQQLTKELGIAYARIALNKQDVNSYEIDHTGTVMLFNPDGQLNAFFTAPLNAEALAKDYKLLVS